MQQRRQAGWIGGQKWEVIFTRALKESSTFFSFAPFLPPLAEGGRKKVLDLQDPFQRGRGRGSGRREGKKISSVSEVGGGPSQPSL